MSYFIIRNQKTMNQNNTKAMNNKFFLVIIPLIITACNGSKENTEKSGTASYSINSAIVDVSEVVGVELFAGRLSQGLDADIRFVGSDSVVARGKVIFLSPYLKKKSLFSQKANEQEDRLVREVRIKLEGDNGLILNSKVESVIKL